MQHNFKIGDKVRVIRKDSSHCFAAGEIVKIKNTKGWLGEDERCICTNDKGIDQGVGVDDLEPMSLTIQNIEIKDGYLLVVKTGKEIHNMTVLSDEDDDLGCVTPSKHWWPLYEFANPEARYEDSQVIAIYGRTRNQYLLDNSTEDRKLLWERKEPKKMTVKEIRDALGYDVEIIK